jgi:hypothetical protein
VRLIHVTWRNSRTIAEYSGGNLGRECLLHEVSQLIHVDDLVIYKVEDFDSIASRLLAGVASASAVLRSQKLTGMFREFRFGYVGCPNRLHEDLKGDSLVVVDNIRGLVMLRRCLGGRHASAPIVLISGDFYAEHPYGRHVVGALSGLLRRRAREALRRHELKLIIVPTYRDRYLYELDGIGTRIVVFPTICPPRNQLDFSRKPRDRIVVNMIGTRDLPQKLIEVTSAALARNGIKVEFVSIGRQVPGAIHIPNLPRDEFLAKLAEGHVGLNYGSPNVLQSGINVKRLDFAIAGNVPFNYHTSVTGLALPNEVAFIDSYDFVGKLAQYDADTLIEMGKENAHYVMNVRDAALANLKRALAEIL